MNKITDEFIAHIGFLLLGLLVYRLVKTLWVSVITLETRFKLYRLRDKVRKTAIHSANYSSTNFFYLDKSISKTITVLPDLNFWILGFYVFKHRENAELNQLRTKVQETFKNDEIFKIHYEEYVGICQNYVMYKSIVSLLFTAVVYGISKIAMVGLGRMKTLPKKFAELRDLPQYTTFLPETSTARIYYG